MEQFYNSLQTSVTDNRLKEVKDSLVWLLNLRNEYYFFKSGGRDNQERDHWRCILVDVGKAEEYLEIAKITSIDHKKYGKILDSGWGNVVPQGSLDKTKKFIKDMKTYFLIVRLQRDQKTYYVLRCVDVTESEVIESRSVDVLERCGMILYSSRDEDPPEALVDMIERGYFFYPGRQISSGDDEGHFEAARNGDAKRVRNYLEGGRVVDYSDGDGWTMLHHAAYSGDPNTIKLLKDMGANVHVQDNICGRKPIHIASRECQTIAIELFLLSKDSVNDVDRNGWTPLHYAAWRGGAETVRFLIDRKANINARDRFLGKKAIHVAAFEGHTNIVKILLEEGANLDDGDTESNQTPLYYATKAGRLETATFLIDSGADINIENKDGTKPIHVSSEKNFIDMQKLLLGRGSDIEARNSFGITPLHFAAGVGSINVVRFLVGEKGANVFAASNYQGITPFDLAKEHVETASYLAERMCEIYEAEDKYSNALKIYEKLLKIQKQKLGKNHPKTQKTYNNIASVLFEQDKYDEALDIFKRVLDSRTNALGPYHSDTLHTRYELGRVYDAQWNLTKAMENYKEVFENWKGAGDLDMLRLARDMALVHFKKCEHHEAFRIFKDVFEKRKIILNADHPDTLQAWQDMAIVLLNMGENKKAFKIFKDIFEKRKASLGVDHPQTIAAGCYIAEMSRRLKKEQQEKGCTIQ